MVQISSYSLLALLNIVEHDDIETPSQVYVPTDLKENFSSIIRRIKQLQSESLEEQALSIQTDFLQLRQELLKWVLQSENFDLMFEVAMEEMQFLRTNINDKKLNERLGRSLEIIEKITSSFIEEFQRVYNPNLSPELLLQKAFSNITLDETTVTNLTRESVACEYSIILTDLAASGAIEFPRGLADFIYESTQRYGAYCLLGGLWKPANNVSNNEILGCKMLADIIQIERGDGNSINLYDLTK